MMKAIRNWIRRQWCRAGLHRWSEWQDLDMGKRGVQFKHCLWCQFTDQRIIQKYTLGEILMEFARRKE